MKTSPLVHFMIFTLTVKAVQPLNEESNCTMLRNAFANTTSEFISCAIQHSRPITLCENCVNLYMDIVETYDNMKKFPDNGTYCIDRFVNLDRLEIVQTLYWNSIDLWNKAKCYECFRVSNGTITPNKSDETITFNQKYDKFMQCINQTNINDTTLCLDCMDDYLDLNEYYSSISDENARIGVCMDIVDLMNNTQLFWSQKCCKYRKHNEYIFVASTVSVLFATLMFYVIVQFCSVGKTPTILQQTRLAESLNQLNHS